MSVHTQTITISRYVDYAELNCDIAPGEEEAGSGEGDTWIDVHVSVIAWPRPGKLFGPPEDCYPADPMEWEYTTTPAGMELTEDERAIVEEKIERNDDDE